MAGGSAFQPHLNPQGAGEKVLLHGGVCYYARVSNQLGASGQRGHLCRCQGGLDLLLFRDNFGLVMPKVVCPLYRKVIKRTGDIMKIFDHSIKALRDTYFHSQ